MPLHHASLNLVCDRKPTETLCRRQQNRLIDCICKSEAEVTNNKGAQGIALLKLTTERHEASRCLYATAGLNVPHRCIGNKHCNTGKAKQYLARAT